MLCFPGFAQSSIDAFHTTYISANNPNSYTATPASGSGSFSSCTSTNYSYSFNNGSSNLLKLLDITTNSKNYYISGSIAGTIKLRRVNNASVTGNRSIISMESTLSTASACPASGQISLAVPYQDQMETFLNSNYLNQGTDNIFANTGNGDGNNNNIERVDVIFSYGMQSSIASDAGFAIFDRGVDKGHDGFRIAAITSLDASGNPASFGALKTCTKGNGTNNGNWGHPTTANGNKTFAVYVLRKDENETNLKVAAAINQQVGGVFFSFADLGISNNQRIYGYSVFSTDGLANPTSAQLLSINDATIYPTNTTETYGGLDMMAINAVFQTSSNPLASYNISLAANATNQGNKISWQLPGDAKNSNAVLERSLTGHSFQTIYSIPLSSLSGNYLDKYNGNAYYRIKIISPGNIRFGPVVFAETKTWQSPKVFPTVITQTQYINFTGVRDGKYKLILTDINGTEQNLSITVTSNRTIACAAFVVKGLVFVQLIGEDGMLYQLGKLVIQ